MITVIETPSNLARTTELGLTEDERSAIIMIIAADPQAGELMQGTGAARKVRIAGRGEGKSGGYRLITFYAASDVPAFLLDIYGKDEKDNLTKAERNEVAKYLTGLADDYRANVKKRVAALKKKGT
jgi:hypothetical protein